MTLKNFGHWPPPRSSFRIGWLMSTLIIIHFVILTGGMNGISHLGLNTKNNGQKLNNQVIKTQTSYQYRGGQNQEKNRAQIQTQTAYRNSYRYQYQYKYGNQYQQQRNGRTPQNNQKNQNNFNQLNQDYAFASLHWVNRYRHLHQAQSMSLDPDLMQRANNCALYYAKKGIIDHSCGQKNGAGENLFMYRSLYSFSGRKDAALQAINSWYKEQKFYKNLYHRDPNGFNTAWGHFTALVWASSSKFGIGIATVGSRTCVVALFDPPGNYLGRFQDNVLPPLRF